MGWLPGFRSVARKQGLGVELSYWVIGCWVFGFLGVGYLGFGFLGFWVLGLFSAPPQLIDHCFYQVNIFVNSDPFAIF